MKLWHYVYVAFAMSMLMTGVGKCTAKDEGIGETLSFLGKMRVGRSSMLQVETFSWLVIEWVYLVINQLSKVDLETMWLNNIWIKYQIIVEFLSVCVLCMLGCTMPNEEWHLTFVCLIQI